MKRMTRSDNRWFDGPCWQEIIGGVLLPYGLNKGQKKKQNERDDFLVNHTINTHRQFTYPKAQIAIAILVSSSAQLS